MKAAFVWHDHYLGYYFGPHHPFQAIREKATFNLLKELQTFNGKAKVIKARKASETELRLVHTKDYINFVKEKSKIGRGYLDYGDTPARKGIYEASCYRVGGSLVAADLAMKGIRAFNPGGGLHHAKPGAAAGFCVFNDVAIAARYLQKKYGLKRIAIVDIDGHHGDGTQQVFYEEPILTISLHRYGLGFYPGTGSENEKGKGKGKGYCINVPFEAGTDDTTYLRAFNKVVPAALKKYKPEAIILQFGVDGYRNDPLVGLALTTKAYAEIATTIRDLASKLCSDRLIITGGGGYSLTVKRCWAIMFLIMSEQLDKNNKEHIKLFD